MNSQNQLGKTVLFISELPENIVDSDLEIFFRDYKDYILMIQVDRNGRMFEAYGSRSPRATIVFKEHDKAEEARKNLNMRRLKGKTLNIMWHEKDNSVRYNNTANIFIKGISPTITPREVYVVFSKFGEIISSKLCEDEDGNFLGYGYINYYNLESAERAIKELNKKEMWGNTLEVGHFQKKNERLQSYLMNNNSIYVKNFPASMTDAELKAVFKEYGAITWGKIYTDPNGRKFGILVFDTPENALKAKENLNGKKINKDTNESLYVDLLQKKSERKRLLNTKIVDINSKLNQEFKNCNLHIKNLPYNLTEAELKEAFSKFGEIKSVKIQKYILVTKVNGVLKESEESKGFGYVCFTSPESAQKAMAELNEKYFPGYENEKRPPLLINYFMPKNERKQILSNIQGDLPMSKFPLVVGHHYPGMPFGGNMYGHPYGMGYQRQPPKHFMHRGRPHMMQQQPRQQQPPTEKQKTTNKEDEPNMKYLESLDTIEAQKEYIGEFLFKKIEQHPLAHEKTFTIDIIGRITGMILGIEDIKEIYEITTNYDNLTSRINEALSLLEGQNA